MSICQLWGFAGPWPLLLLFVHLVERFSNDVVFRPLDGRASNYVLRLRYRRESGCCLGVYVRRVLAPSSRLVTGGSVGAVGLGYVCKTSKCGREKIVVRSCCLCALLLQGAHEAFRILNCSMLEFFQRFQVTLALLSLYLQK